MILLILTYNQVRTVVVPAVFIYMMHYCTSWKWFAKSFLCKYRMQPSITYAFVVFHYFPPRLSHKSMICAKFGSIRER